MSLGAKSINSSSICNIERSNKQYFRINYRSTTIDIIERDFLRNLQSCIDWTKKAGTWQPDEKFQLTCENLVLSIDQKDLPLFNHEMLRIAADEFKIVDFLYIEKVFESYLKNSKLN